MKRCYKRKRYIRSEQKSVEKEKKNIGIDFKDYLVLKTRFYIKKINNKMNKRI